MAGGGNNHRDDPGEKRLFLGNSNTLTPSDIALIKDIVDIQADQIVTKRLIAIGIDPDNPLQTQSDMMFLRSRRELTARGAWQFVTVVISLVAAGALAWIWSGFKMSIK